VYQTGPISTVYSHIFPFSDIGVAANPSSDRWEGVADVVPDGPKGKEVARPRSPGASGSQPGAARARPGAFVGQRWAVCGACAPEHFYPRMFGWGPVSDVTGPSRHLEPVLFPRAIRRLCLRLILAARRPTAPRLGCSGHPRWRTPSTLALSPRHAFEYHDGFLDPCALLAQLSQHLEKVHARKHIATGREPAARFARHNASEQPRKSAAPGDRSGAWLGNLARRLFRDAVAALAVGIL
jgi:hypothetical protein